MKAYSQKKNEAWNTKNKNKKADESGSINPIYLINQIDQTKNSFFAVISSYRNEVLDMLATLETHGKMFFNKISQETKYMINL